MKTLYKLARPLLFRLDPEAAHNLTIKALKTGLIPHRSTTGNKALQVTLWNRHFPGPVGIAAGFDKNAEVIAPLLRLGCGFVEVGTVTPQPQAGNPRPRIFRAPDNEAVINRMGFPNRGLAVFRRNLEIFRASNKQPDGLIGLNIGMNKDQSDPAQDYTMLVRELAPLADYLTVNISSPNTPGLRDLQTPEHLAPLLDAIMAARNETCQKDPPPLLVKLAPDLDDRQKEDIAKTVMACGIDGLILTNTTLDRPTQLAPGFAGEKGGLSGAPLRDKATQTIRDFYALTGERLPLIGVGGISSGADAYEKIKAGASLVQLYSALVFKGPDVVHSINMELKSLLQRDRFSHISEAVGAETGTQDRHDTRHTGAVR